MRITSRRRAIVFFLSLGVCLAAVAVAVGFGWIILNWRAGLKVFLGVIFFGAITAGLILNTIFLVREIRRNEQHDSFINAVTHELKTPIASIRLYLETLARREVDENQRRDFYRLMLLDSDRLLGTVEQVLKAGRAGHKRAGREFTQVDFGSLVKECIDLASTRHHLQPGALYLDGFLSQGNASVTGDPEELRTAVSNLLDNAVKYSGNQVDVAVQLETPDARHVVLRVRDHGVGIPRHELKRIFRRFYRVPNRSVSQVKGTGLGLFIVRSIARKHGGKVSAESEGEGLGTTVTLELPRSAS
ncbi:MAG: two-component sensor histidine kinase [Acidobacteria bacterium]|nr:MAG: two-component sensor histidine kinase [Acidobacteriota bacterium]PYY06521.1 MAG: two-component sensor histidine kinase [Acidobacteriota bacterium]